MKLLNLFTDVQRLVIVPEDLVVPKLFQNVLKKNYVVSMGWQKAAQKRIKRLLRSKPCLAYLLEKSFLKNALRLHLGQDFSKAQLKSADDFKNHVFQHGDYLVFPKVDDEGNVIFLGCYMMVFKTKPKSGA